LGKGGTPKGCQQKVAVKGGIAPKTNRTGIDFPQTTHRKSRCTREKGAKREKRTKSTEIGPKKSTLRETKNQDFLLSGGSQS